MKAKNKGSTITRTHQRPGESKNLIAAAVQILDLMGDESRMKILVCLANLGVGGEIGVTPLVERLGQSQPAVSHHLSLLRVAGLIEARREGKHVYYSLVSEVARDVLGAVLRLTPR